MSNVKQEMQYLKGEYNTPKQEHNGFKKISILIIEIILKILLYSFVAFSKMCIAIFWIIIFAPLYMFFGIKPKYKKYRF